MTPLDQSSNLKEGTATRCAPYRRTLTGAWTRSDDVTDSRFTRADELGPLS